MQRVNVGLLCLLSLSLAGITAAQTAVQPNADVGSASLQDFSGGATIRGTYFDVRHSSGSGVGYRNGYTQIGAFTPFWLGEDAFIAPNSRLLLTDTSDVGVNTGLVARRYSNSVDRIFGINGYFDSDMSALGNRYQQATLGFETLGTYWDFRANGYFGVGKTDRFVREICVGGDPFFVGNKLAFLGHQLREESLAGADVELGVPVFPSTPWLRAYGGLYGYQSSGKEPIGVKGRLEAWVSDDLSVSVNVTDDRHFGTNVNAVVDFRFAGFRPTRYFPQWTTRERMLMPVQRNWRVATDTYSQNINIAAVNPADGLPYFISHINNTAAPGGDGSAEHPFNTLPASVPGASIILVAAGSTTEGAPLIGSIALQDNQRLLGEGKAHFANLFASYGGCVVNRTYQLPGTANTGNYPFLSSVGNIITLANNNEVAGFNLLNAGGDAITNTMAGSNNFLLQCLEISGNNGVGINLQNATGVGIIRGVNLASGSTNHPNPGGFGNNSGGGVFVSVGAGNLDLRLTNVAMNSDPAGTQAFGIHLQETGRQLTATLNNVQSSGNAGVGVQVLGDAGTVTLTATTPGGQLISNNNGGDNLNITLTNGTIFQGDIINGEFSGSTGGSGVVYNQSGGSGRLNLTNVHANNNAIDGLAVFGSNGTTMNTNVFTSTLTNNAEDGIHVEGTTGSTMDLFVNASDVRFNGRDGLFFNLNLATLNVTSASNLMDNNNRSAIRGQMDNSIADLLFSNTTGNLSGDHGFFLDANNNSTAVIAILGGTLADSGRLNPGLSDGVHIESDLSNIRFRMADTPANNTLVPPLGTQRHGMFLDIVNGSTFDGLVTNGNFTNNLQNALNANFAGDSIATLVLDNTPLDNSGADGIHVTLTGSNTVATITLQNGTTNNNSGADGLDFNVNDGTLTVHALSSSFVGSGQTTGAGNGILGVINNTGTVNLNFSDTPITGSFDNGVFVTAMGGSDIVAVFDNSPLDDNGLTTNGDGVRFDLNGSTGSRLDLTNSQPLLINQTNVNRNGGNGVVLNATNGTVFTENFDTLSISDNGQTAGTGNGVVVNVDAVAGADSTVTLTFNAATIINTPLNIANNPPGGTQQIGFQFNVQNGGVLTAGFTASNVSNNIVNAFNGFVTGAGSTSLVTLDSTVANNSGADGAVLTVLAGGRQDFLLSNVSSINDSGGTGLIATIDGVNTLANISLNASAINRSATFGSFLTVTGGSTLNFSGTNISSISNSGAAGVFVTSSEANSVVNLAFDNMSVDANGLVFGGAGLNGAALNGGTLNGCFVATSFSGNSNEGLNLLVTGANSLGQFGVNTSVFDNNGREGLSINVASLGVLNYRSQNSTYSGNGVTGAFDGVNATVTGTGAADTVTTARFLFSTDTVNNNTDDGFDFTANNGATLVVSLDTITAINNVGYGLRFSANDPGTKAYLLMSGANQLSPNGMGAMNINIGAIDTAVLSLSGDFSNNNGDGLFLDLTGVTNAAVAIHGPGTTINGNGFAPFAGPSGNGDGIDIRMSGNTFGSVRIFGVESIDGNAADGIHIEFTDVANGAIEVSGTAIGNSGDDAIDIALNNTNLVDGLVFPAVVPPVQGLTLTDSLATPLNFCLPLPVPLDLTALGVIPTQGLIISGNTIDNSTANGVSVLGINSTIATATVADNVISRSNGGDGVHFNLLNTPVATMTITGNQVGGSLNNGVNFDLDNSPIGVVTISNNTIGEVVGLANTPIDDTLPVIRAGFNQNTLVGLDVTTGLVPVGFNGDFFGVNFNQVYVNMHGNITFNAPLFTFTPFNLLSTGAPIIAPFFADVDGRAPANPLRYGTGMVNGRAAFGVDWKDMRFYNVTVPANGTQTNDFQLVLIDRSDVAPGDFDFEFNYADVNWEAGTLSGGNTQGLWVGPGGGPARAGWSNGVATAFELPGSGVAGAFLNTGPAATSLRQSSLNSIHPGRYTFFVRGGLIGGAAAPNGDDGIRLNASNGSNISAFTANANEITNSGQHGVEILLTNSNLVNPLFSNNNIHDNTGDGIRMVNPGTAGGSLNLTFTDNTIGGDIGGTTGGNTGAGVNLSFDANHTGPAVNLNFNSVGVGNRISNNGSFGVHVVATDTETAPITLTVGGTGAANTFENNVDAGMGLEFRNTAVVAHNVTVSNAIFRGTTNSVGEINFNGDGLGIRLTNEAELASLTIGAAGSVNTTFGGAVAGQGNAGDGFTLFATDGTAVNGTALIQNVNALGNGASGLHIDTRVTAQIADLQIISTLAGDTIGTNTLHGIQLNRIDNSQLTTLIDRLTITGNTGDGINGFYGNAAGLQLLTIQNSAINSNTDGIDLTVAANAQLLATITDNTLNSNSNNGIVITTNNTAAFGDDLGGAPSVIAGNIITDSLNRATDAADSGMRFNANNASFQNVLIQASATNRTAISGYGNGITVNNASSFTRVAPAPTQNTWNIFGTDLSANAADGIQLNLTGSGGSVVNIGGLVAANANVTISGTRVGDTQNGINANLIAGTNNLSIGASDANGATTNSVDITSMGHDGITITQTGGRANVAILNTSSRLNVRRGLNIFDSAPRGGGATPADTYVVGGGSGARDINGAAVGALGDGNIFSSNDQQGMVFDTLSTQVSNSQFAASDPFGVNARDTGSTNFTYATLYAIQNTIQNSVNADGMVLSVGSNTRLNAMVSGNTVNANALDDVRIYATASVNPASSTNNAPTSPITPNDIYVRDPVAHLDLVFGALDTNNDGIPETIGTINSINVGNQVNAVQFGGAGTAAITRTGVFTNADPFKSDRRVQLFGRIGIENGLGQLNFPNNNFFQLGTQQIMYNGGVFDFLAPKPLGTFFPDPTFLPFP